MSSLKTIYYSSAASRHIIPRPPPKKSTTATLGLKRIRGDTAVYIAPPPARHMEDWSGTHWRHFSTTKKPERSAVQSSYAKARKLLLCLTSLGETVPGARYLSGYSILPANTHTVFTVIKNVSAALETRPLVLAWHGMPEREKIGTRRVWTRTGGRGYALNIHTQIPSHKKITSSARTFLCIWCAHLRY